MTVLSATTVLSEFLRGGHHNRQRHVSHFLADDILYIIATDKRNRLSFESSGRASGHIHELIDEPVELVALPTLRNRHEHPQDLWNFHKGTLSPSMGVPSCVRYTRLAVQMSLSGLLGFQQLPLLFRPDRFVVDEIFFCAELRHDRHLFEQRHGVVEIEF
jgi:hypothetical protein